MTTQSNKKINKVFNNLAVKLADTIENIIDINDYEIESNIMEDINYFKDTLQIEFNRDYN